MEVKKFGLNSFTLHIIACFCMLLDHMWATVVSGNMWMTHIGRIAFPIFAFMIAEGYYHTSNYKKYLKRLIVFALISEIPFNLMLSGSLFSIFHQNVIWTFVISLILIRKLDKIQNSDKSNIYKIFMMCLFIFLGYILGTVLFVDYYGFGVLTVVVFYLFHDRSKWYNFVFQAIGMYLINFVLMMNMDIPITIFGHEFFFPTQGFAILALIPIWLYNGSQGPKNKFTKYFFYAFYPAHMLILSIFALI